MRKKFCLIIVLCSLLFTSLAQAQENQIKKMKRASITLSMPMIAPTFEVTGELRLHPKFSIAGILGAGFGPMYGFNARDALSSTMGGQFRYYAIGDFGHGMQIGLEVLFRRVITSSMPDTTHTTTLHLAPFIGYKVLFHFGMTLDIQLGLEYAPYHRIERPFAKGIPSTQGPLHLAPLVNLNLGWSF